MTHKFQEFYLVLKFSLRTKFRKNIIFKKEKVHSCQPHADNEIEKKSVSIVPHLDTTGRQFARGFSHIQTYSKALIANLLQIGFSRLSTAHRLANR